MDRRPPPSSTLPTCRPSITSSLPRPPSAVPATPSSRIPFGSKRPPPSSSTLDEPPSALRRTNTSTALQVDLERRLGVSNQKVRELERQVEEGKREVEDVRNMMRLLVADEEGREREHGQARENLQHDLVRVSFISALASHGINMSLTSINGFLCFAFYRPTGQVSRGDPISPTASINNALGNGFPLQHTLADGTPAVAPGVRL